MARCNDCHKNSDPPMLVRGVSDLAGGEYYKGPEICEHCMIIRRENAIAEREAESIRGKYEYRT